MDRNSKLSSEDLERSEPSRELGTVGPAVAAHVAEARRQLSSASERDSTTGQFIVGQVAAGGSLAESRQLLAALAPLREQIADATLADLGQTRDEAPQTLVMVVRDLALLELMEENFLAYEQERARERGGVMFVTAKGKTSAVAAKILAIIDRKAKLITMLGIERKAKRLDIAQAFSDQERDRA